MRAARSCDIFIYAARIMDGSGALPVVGDVALVFVRIASLASDPREHHIRCWHPLHRYPTPHNRQLCCDPEAAPSREHGMTQLITGNCSMRFAPLHSITTDRLIRRFGLVNEMEEDLLG